jgi:hypothetical protein
MILSAAPRFSLRLVAGLRWIAALVLGWLGGAGLVDAADYAPVWQTFSAPALGVTVDVTTDTHVTYRLSRENFVTAEVRERGRSGPKTDERTSSFNFVTVDLGDRQIQDAAGLLNARANLMITNTGLSNFKVVKNQALTFKGLPAREVIFSFTIDFFGTPATRRYLLVARDNRYYTFGWVWGDAGPVPADSKRIANSIRFMTPIADPHARSRALLEETILLYWLREDYPDRLHLSPALKAIADKKRAAESKLVQSYGYVQQVEFRGWEKGYRVFRVEHSNEGKRVAVDWHVLDDGSNISGLTWKKVRDL